MEFIFLIVGVIIGITITLIRERFTKAYGFIEIDHDKQLCKVALTSEELVNTKKKKAVLKIVHDVDISHDIQSL